MAAFGTAATDLGLGDQLASQVSDETDEERKKRQQQQQDATIQPFGAAASNPITDALDPDAQKKKKAMQPGGAFASRSGPLAAASMLFA